MEQGQQAEQSGRINVTYESLFDLVVREKSRDDLQTLNVAFFSELVSYLNEKRSALNIMTNDEKEKASRQIQNINRLVKELYERREKKIMSLALARSRAGVDIVDTSAFLTEEKTFFDNLVTQLDLFREGVLNSLLTARMPRTQQEGAETLAAASRIITENPLSSISGTNFHAASAAEAGENPNRESSIGPSRGSDLGKQKNTKLVKFLHAVPRFVGSELEVYGPFDREDIANLPREIADVLIIKGRAEEMAQA